MKKTKAISFCFCASSLPSAHFSNVFQNHLQLSLFSMLFAILPLYSCTSFCKMCPCLLASCLLEGVLLLQESQGTTSMKFPRFPSTPTSGNLCFLCAAPYRELDKSVHHYICNVFSCLYMKEMVYSGWLKWDCSIKKEKVNCTNAMYIVN